MTGDEAARVYPQAIGVFARAEKVGVRFRGSEDGDRPSYRACGLNLVVNAIILWNTVYLSRAVNFVRELGVHIQDRLLAQVAPIPWGHIGITGDYLWNEIDQPIERFRPLRANRFNPKAFVFP